MITENEKEKLSLLLVYWIEHNKEHEKDFKRWAEKAKEFVEIGTEVYEAIMEAVEHMEEVNECLLKAFEDIKNLSFKKKALPKK
jgi:nickel/cobalt exporter